MLLRYTCLLVLLIFSQGLAAQILSIAEARDEGVGAFVSVRGVVTAGEELGDIRYFQDGTAALAAFGGNGGPSGFDDLGPGDSILISGQLKLYNGLLELSPVTNFTLLQSGVALPAPLVIAEGDLDESVESRLVTVSCAQIDGNGTFGSGTYAVTTAGGGAFPIYLRGGHPLSGTPVPDGPQNITGVVSTFNGYQLLPRGPQDLEPTACFGLTSTPRISAIQTDGFTITWTTDAPATSTLRYGTTPAMGQSLGANDVPTTTHSVTLTDLTPATFYYVQAESAANGGTALSPVQLHITASESTHTIETYFNFPVEESLSNGSLPAGDSYQEAEARLLGIINDAQLTVDIAAYNMTRSAVMTALKNAHNRGVRVRYIREADTGNQALGTPAFPVLTGGLDDPLMHNKFLVVDAALVDESYVLMGSMNFTNSNIVEDYNNYLLFQDQSLALTYEREFEEMWGSSGAQYDADNARFGSAKTDNTPHYFNIGGVPVESWFSPTDKVTNAIKRALGTADHEIDVALLLITRFDLRDELIDANNNGVRVRGLYNNPTDAADELFAAGVDFFEDNSSSRMLHHKYAVIDGRHPDSDPAVVTGSHNWTNKAETTNDENTVIVYDADIANLFVQEFQARWQTTVSVDERNAVPALRVAPNPATDQVRVQLPEGIRSATLTVSDLHGRQWAQRTVSAGYPTVDLGALGGGTYVLQLQTNDARYVGKLVVLR